MFSLSQDTIDTATLKATMIAPEAGAFTSFEGWVRNHNEGKAVTRLEYEAYESMAVAEGCRIVEDAIRRFGLITAHCVHRIGGLGIGDMAVWVGAVSAHRDEAFKACRYIIDEVKHRVPIWKKEYYIDGNSGWVNCERCAAHGHGPVGSSVAPDPALYYDRQIRLREIGTDGQHRLANARVLVVGLGGLGSPAATYLASAGIGVLGLCESDSLDISNLHRQPLYSAIDVGKPKIELALHRLRALNPGIELRQHDHRLTAENAYSLFNQYDLVLDCTDNFPTKFLINDAAVLLGMPAVFGSLYQFEGQIQVYVPGESACLRCLWPTMPDPGCVGTCAEVGVLGAIPGILGAMQAMEALRQLLAIPGGPVNGIAIVDCLDLSIRKVVIEKSSGCPVCGANPSISDLSPENYGPDESIELDYQQILIGTIERFTLVDVRELDEVEREPISLSAVLSVPLSRIDFASPPFECDRSYVLCCSHGHRSRSAARVFHKQGYPNVFSLRGGIRSLPAKS
ncbi:MAG: hypothetical protein AMXMBFR84_13230 [Candidatus Hydrogenedentota bacterium]